VRGADVTLAPVPGPEWDALVAQSGRPYRYSHRSAAGRAFEEAYPSYRFTPLRVEYADGSELLFPLVRVRRRVRQLGTALASPLGLEGRPVAVQGAPRGDHFTQLFAALDGVGQLVVNGGAGGSPPDAGVVSTSATHVVDLRPGYEALWERSFAPSNRNKCRKAERGGVEVAEDSSDEAVDAYYSLYAQASAEWGYDEPPYPSALFRALLAHGSAELWIARLDGRPVAGSIVLRGSHDLCYWSAALDREHRDVAPSNAVLRAVIESGCERGFDYVDLGGSTGLPGVEAFKLSFGGIPVEYRSISLTTTTHRLLEASRRRLARSGRR
jgi:CelD/BcsL family acetyltransferase involved in cellulose biosynthesis